MCEKWFPRDSNRAELCWPFCNPPPPLGLGSGPVQLHIMKGPTHFCFHPHHKPVFLLSANCPTQRVCLCLSFPPGSPDKEANLYPLLLPRGGLEKHPVNRGMDSSLGEWRRKPRGKARLPIQGTFPPPRPCWSHCMEGLVLLLEARPSSWWASKEALFV